MTSPRFKLGAREVGHGCPPLIVAEMSGNHGQSLDRALAIIDAAADAGADAVKLQTYTADTMTLDIHEGAFVIDDPSSLWHGESLYQLYQRAHTPWDWHAQLFSRCHDRGMMCFSTPFDASAVDFLEELGAPCYKVASFENTDHALIRKIAATGKPLIMSTGISTLEELGESVTVARDAGCEHIMLLKCTSAYPTPLSEVHLRTMPDLRDRLRVHVGLSDHTQGIAASIASVALGAELIERHFTLDRADGGVDAAFSLEPAELSALVAGCRAAWEALGEVHYGPTERELGSTGYRRSLYISRDLRAGERLSSDNVRAIRPGGGLPVKHYQAVMGRTVKRDVMRGTPLSWELLET